MQKGCGYSIFKLSTSCKSHCIRNCKWHWTKSILGPYVVLYVWMFTLDVYQSGTQSQTCHFILKAGRISAAHSDPSRLVWVNDWFFCVLCVNLRWKLRLAIIVSVIFCFPAFWVFLLDFGSEVSAFWRWLLKLVALFSFLLNERCYSIQKSTE